MLILKKNVIMVLEIQVVDSNSREISLMAKDSSSEMIGLNASVTNVSNSFNEFYSKVRSLVLLTI